MKKIFKKAIISVLLLINLSLPFNVFAYSDYILAGGQNIGIELKSDGVLIVGTYQINGNDPAKKANLQTGDKILSINSKEIKSIEEMINIIDNSTNIQNIDITDKRGSNILNTTLEPIIDENILK